MADATDPHPAVHLNVTPEAECAICLDPIGATEEPFSTGACRHLFHTGCIHRWVTDGIARVDLHDQLDARPCPTCRRELGSTALGMLGCFDTPLDAPAYEWRCSGPTDLRLNWSVRHGDLVRVRALLCMGHPVSKYDSCFDSPFPPDKEGGPSQLAFPMLEAVCFGHIEIVRAFLESGLPEHCDSNGLTLAAERGNMEMVRLFLEHGELLDDPERTKVGYKETPLTAAAEAGQLEMVGFLLDRGADIEAYIFDEGTEACTNGTALMVACRYGHLEVAKLLLSRGANPAHYDEADYGPLECALTQSLRRDGPEHKRQATKSQQLQMVRLLCADPRIDLEHENEQGQTVRAVLDWYHGDNPDDPAHVAALVAALGCR